MFDIAYRIGRSSIRSRLPFVYFDMLPVITMSLPPSHMQRGHASLTLRRLRNRFAWRTRRAVRSRTLLGSRRLARFDGTAILSDPFGRCREQPAGCSRSHRRRVRLPPSRRTQHTSKRATNNRRKTNGKAERAIARRSLARLLSKVYPGESVPFVPRSPPEVDSGFLQSPWDRDGRRRLHRCDFRRLSELDPVPRGVGRSWGPRARGAGPCGLEHGHNRAVATVAAEWPHVHLHHHVGRGAAVQARPFPVPEGGPLLGSPRSERASRRKFVRGGHRRRIVDRDAFAIDATARSAGRAERRSERDRSESPASARLHP